MIIFNESKNASIQSLIAFCLSLGSFIYFVGTVGHVEPLTLYVHITLTVVIGLLSTNQINKNQDKMLNGVTILITAIPWMYFILMIVLSNILAL